MHKALLTAAAAASIGGAALAQEPVTEDEEEILIVKRIAPEEIVITGGLPRCARRPGDPMDAVDVSKVAADVQMMIVADPTGTPVLAKDNDPIGGDTWQRAGLALEDYVFRAPVDGTPLCIGSKARRARGKGQLRRIVDARPFHGKGVRMSGYIATNRHADVRFWLAAGLAERGVIAGDKTPAANLSKKAGWTPFVFEIPHVPDRAWSISYGFLLDGGGDAWVHDIKLEAIPAGGKDKALWGGKVGR